MRAILPSDELGEWIGRFLPRLATGDPASLFRHAVVSNWTDGKIADLDGLNLSRAWCWASLAGALPQSLSELALETAEHHLAVGLPRLQSHYMGEHWLATYALLALDAGEPAPDVSTPGRKPPRMIKTSSSRLVFSSSQVQYHGIKGDGPATHWTWNEPCCTLINVASLLPKGGRDGGHSAEAADPNWRGVQAFRSLFQPLHRKSYLSGRGDG